MYADNEGPAWESSSANRDLCKAAPELIPWGSSCFEPQTGIGELSWHKGAPAGSSLQAIISTPCVRGEGGGGGAAVWMDRGSDS